MTYFHSLEAYEASDLNLRELLHNRRKTQLEWELPNIFACSQANLLACIQ